MAKLTTTTTTIITTISPVLAKFVCVGVSVSVDVGASVGVGKGASVGVGACWLSSTRLVEEGRVKGRRRGERERYGSFTRLCITPTFLSLPSIHPYLLTVSPPKSLERCCDILFTLSCRKNVMCCASRGVSVSG